MQKLFLFIHGYIYIRISGFAPERFVNLCGNRGIFLWGIQKEDEVYFMYMKLKDFFLIAPLVRKTKVKVVLLKKIGLPFLVPEIYKRKFFMLGLVTTFWLWWISSFFVWKIDLVGNVQITNEDILRTLQEQNVMVGGMVKNVNYEELEKFLRNTYNEIIWISVKQNGTILEINIKENTTILEEPKEEKACDLVATVDGKIKDMVVRKGVPLLYIGQEVKSGDVIVSGRIEILNDDTTVREVKMVHSDADVWIEYQLPVNIVIPKVYIEKYYTGRTEKDYKLLLNGGRSFETKRKISFQNYDQIWETKEYPKVLLWNVPAHIICIFSREFYEIEYENDLNEASQKLEDAFRVFLVNLNEKGVQIISKDVRIEEGSDRWILTGTVTALHQAKEERLIEEVYE
ncbi:MAG: sporulation protein YqfD [Lachnospiraceae bacterium]|nr:sporulation protein YqfD [Lachnospiraceae bacterium]